VGVAVYIEYGLDGSWYLAIGCHRFYRPESFANVAFGCELTLENGRNNGFRVHQECSRYTSLSLEKKLPGFDELLRIPS
jgi:hypothetical protein